MIEYGMEHGAYFDTRARAHQRREARPRLLRRGPRLRPDRGLHRATRSPGTPTPSRRPSGSATTSCGVMGGCPATTTSPMGSAWTGNARATSPRRTPWCCSRTKRPMPRTPAIGPTSCISIARGKWPTRSLSYINAEALGEAKRTIRAEWVTQSHRVHPAVDGSGAVGRRTGGPLHDGDHRPGAHRRLGGDAGRAVSPGA